MPGAAETARSQRIEDRESPGDGIFGQADGKPLDGDVRIVGHHQVQIRAEREFQFAINHVILQVRRRTQLHGGNRP